MAIDTWPPTTRRTRSQQESAKVLAWSVLGMIVCLLMALITHN